MKVEEQNLTELFLFISPYGWRLGLLIEERDGQSKQALALGIIRFS